VPTGFHDLDQKTSGLQPGDLIIVAGRPSMGKTAFSINIGENVALDTGLPVAIFSMEMGGAQLVMRMIGSVGRLDQHRLRTGKLGEDDWQRLTYALGKLNEAPVFIDETPGLNVLELRARARRLMRQCGKLGLIIIDYLQLMAGSGGGENRATEISEISRALKSLAKELHVPVIALSQLNRSLEQRPNKRPVMSDLRESGAIEQDADVILFIYRDEVYNPDTQDKGKAEIIISKQRNGPIGMVPLAFLGEYTRFESLAQPDSY
jgi:replicative DNA helicase